MQLIPAQLVTYANNHSTDVRHIAPTLNENNIYDNISQMVWLALSENQNQVIDPSPLSKAGVKILLPDSYAGSAKLKDFEIFISNMLCWLKINCMLKAAGQDWQLTFLGTHLIGKAQNGICTMWNHPHRGSKFGTWRP
jgi:hypothetical protein